MILMELKLMGLHILRVFVTSLVPSDFFLLRTEVCLIFFSNDFSEAQIVKSPFGKGSCFKKQLQKATLQGKSHLCISFLGIARPQSQFPHTFVCELFIYSQD